MRIVDFTNTRRWYSWCTHTYVYNRM